MRYAVLFAAIALAYWAARELLLNTFKNASKRKPYIICFALVGFTLAVSFIVAGRLMHPAYGMLIPPPYGLVQLILCPSALLGLFLMDFPHPSLNSVFVLGLFIAVMNAALYAAVGGRIGAAVLKSRAARS
jgi:hypothetical protein